MSSTVVYVGIRIMPSKKWGHFWGHRPHKDHISPPIWAPIPAGRPRDASRTTWREGSPPRHCGLSVIRRQHCVPQTARRLPPAPYAAWRRQQGEPRPTHRLLLPCYGVRAVAMVVLWYFVLLDRVFYTLKKGKNKQKRALNLETYP